MCCDPARLGGGGGAPSGSGLIHTQAYTREREREELVDCINKPFSTLSKVYLE